MRLNHLVRRLADDRQLAAGVLIGGALIVLVLVRGYGQAGGVDEFLQFTLVGISAGCVYAVAARP